MLDVTVLDPKAILDLELGRFHDAQGSTIRDYMKEMLTALISEGEGFSGKRPLGNSDWLAQLALPLIEAGIIAGVVEDHCAEDFDWTEVEQVLIVAIQGLN